MTLWISPSERMRAYPTKGYINPALYAWAQTPMPGPPLICYPREEGVILMEGDRPMSDQPPLPPEAKDFPDHWGFYLLQAINRLDDKIDDVRRDQEHSAESLRQEMSTLHTKVEQKIDALDTKFDQKLTALQYWYWGTLVVIIIGFVTMLLTHA